MELTKFIRKPFTVEGVEITESNIAEIAELVGSLKIDDKGTQYIALNRRLVPNVGRAYVGWFMTQMGDNVRVYSPTIFKKEFVAAEPVMTFSFDDTALQYGGQEVVEVDQAPPNGIERPDGAFAGDPDMGLSPDAAEVRADDYTVVFSSRDDAEKVLTAMKDVCAKFDIVMVSDLLDLVGLAHTYGDTLLGWNEVTGAQIRNEAVGWILSFPKPLSFGGTPSTPQEAQRTEINGPADTPPIDANPAAQAPGGSPLD